MLVLYLTTQNDKLEARFRIAISSIVAR